MLRENKIILKELAKKYRDYAFLPCHKEKMEMWKDFNSFKKGRPMVTIDQLPWRELNENCEITLKTQDEYWKKIEFNLRQLIYKWEHFPVDMVLEPFVTIPKVISGLSYGLAVNDKKILQTGGAIASHEYINVLENIEDVNKIKDMDLTVDREKTKMRMEEAFEVFDGIIPFIEGQGAEFHIGVWDRLSMYMGIENVYYLILDNPGLLHLAMERITNATIAGIKKANEISAFNNIKNTCHCTYVYDHENLFDFGKNKENGTKSGWAYGMAQLFSSASPEVTREFEIPYITKMAKEFKNIYYGCCERLDDRLEYIMEIPNIRKISCSPWSSREEFSEKLNKNIIMSIKPTPAFLAEKNFDKEKVKKDLEFSFKCARKNSLACEFLLKDISTVANDPGRLTKWAEIAMEVVNS